MRKMWMVGLAMAFVAGMTGYASADHAIGAGANYWRTIDDLKGNPEFDRSGVSYYLSYQYRPLPVLFLEAQLERMPDGFMASPDPVYAPQAYIGAKLLFVYAAAGVGMFYADGEWANDPFYCLRAGVDLTLLPMIHLDINANYRFTTWDQTEDDATDIDTDTIFLGAAARIVF